MAFFLDLDQLLVILALHVEERLVAAALDQVLRPLRPGVGADALVYDQQAYKFYVFNIHKYIHL